MGEYKIEGRSSRYPFSYLHLTHYSRENIYSNFNITAKSEYLISRDHQEDHNIIDSHAMMFTSYSNDRIEICVAHNNSFKRFKIKLQENRLPEIRDYPILNLLVMDLFFTKITDFISPRTPK